MTYHIEPPLVRKMPAVLGVRFRAWFGISSPDAVAPPDYRDIILCRMRARYGTPIPDALDRLIEEAGRIGVAPDELIDFFGVQFRLTPLPHHKNSSS